MSQDITHRFNITCTKDVLSRWVWKRAVFTLLSLNNNHTPPADSLLRALSGLSAEITLTLRGSTMAQDEKQVR